MRLSRNWQRGTREQVRAFDIARRELNANAEWERLRGISGETDIFHRLNDLVIETERRLSPWQRSYTVSDVRMDREERHERRSERREKRQARRDTHRETNADIRSQDEAYWAERRARRMDRRAARRDSRGEARSERRENRSEWHDYYRGQRARQGRGTR